MSQTGLLLHRYNGKPPSQAHHGQISMIRPNLRRTSDGFEIACWIGQSVPVAFTLDACDREVMSWFATAGGLCGEMIRDLMLEIVERLFGGQQTRHPVEWLSDNRSCYRAHETVVSFAQPIGLVPCLAPVRSPQSNAMAESLLKTFNRDYVYVYDRPDAQPVLAQLPRWFEDHNDNHPQKALRIKSPRGFMHSFHQPAVNCAV
jgi:putative transposase